MWVSSFPISAGRSATYSSATTTSTTTFGGYFTDVTAATNTLNTYMQVTDQGWNNWLRSNQTARQTNIWSQWTNTVEDIGYINSPHYQAPEPVVRTAAEIAADEARHRAFLEERSKERSKKLRIQEAIEHRAEELFLSFLSEEQRESYRLKKQVTVCAKSGRTYRINCQHPTHGRIYELDKAGREIAHYCSHVPYGELPGADNLLAQWLAIKFDEKEGFLLRANRSLMLQEFAAHR